MEETSSLHDWLKQSKKRVLCIDGGGTKSTLQILTSTGQDQALFRGGPLNVHDIGYGTVKETLQKLLSAGNPEGSLVVAGIAGAERAQEYRELSKLLQELGYDRFWLRGDGDLLLDALAPTGLVLIAGTGSHCMGVHHGQRARAGGLGRILGDEGSGYWIGLQAIRAALAEQYGWGDSTSLTDTVRHHFTVNSAEELMHPVNSGDLPRSEIAQLASRVLEQSTSDHIAAAIQAAAIDHLADLVRQTKRQLGVEVPPLVLIGGLFRDESFLQQLTNRVELQVENLADRHPIAWAVQQAL